KVVSLAFHVKGSGTGRLEVTDGAITASDGTGSNVYTTSKGLDINIPSTADFQAVTLERAQQAATIAKQLPSVIGLNVPFYPDPTKWNNRSASFQATWNITSDVIKEGIALNNKANFTPDASAQAMSGSEIFPALTDGIWYLHLRSQNNIGWSPTLHYRIAVDTTPPNTFKITSNDGFKTENPSPTINFASSDLVSGIDSYSVRLDGVLATTTNLTSYSFQPILPGTHQLTVIATDKAGNSTSQTSTLEITPIASPSITYVNNRVVVDEGEIIAGGISAEGVEVVVQIQNAQKQIVFEQVVPLDGKDNWNITISKALTAGDYHLIVTARDKKMASSFPVSSDTIKVEQRPVLVLGSFEVSQTWFFVGLIIILLGSFSAGWFAYRNWRGQLGRRVAIAQRDVVNTIENLKKDLDNLIKDYEDGNVSKSDITKMEYTLKKMRASLESSSHYVIDNIREIDN
ncbi:MAG: hypothetical protein WCO18_02230, partial [bacterium]